jgi:hypothetical protein
VAILGRVHHREDFWSWCEASPPPYWLASHPAAEGTLGLTGAPDAVRGSKAQHRDLGSLHREDSEIF